MSCQKCGREGGHNLGCAVAARKRAQRASRADKVIREHAARLEAVVENTKPLEERESDDPPVTVVDTCTKDGCSEPRAVSKGPRPAKYCEGHKFKRKAKE